MVGVGSQPIFSSLQELAWPFACSAYQVQMGHGLKFKERAGLDTLNACSSGSILNAACMNKLYSILLFLASQKCKSLHALDSGRSQSFHQSYINRSPDF